MVCPALGWLAVLAHGHGSTQLLPCRVIEQIIPGTRISSLAAGQELPWLHARVCFAFPCLVTQPGSMGQTWDPSSFTGAFQGHCSIWEIVLIGLIKTWEKGRPLKALAL